MLLFQCLLFLLIISAVPIRAFPQIIHDIHVLVHGAFAFKSACAGTCRTKKLSTAFILDTWEFEANLYNVNIYHVCRIGIVQMVVKITFRLFRVKHTRIVHLELKWWLFRRENSQLYYKVVPIVLGEAHISGIFGTTFHSRQGSGMALLQDLGRSEWWAVFIQLTAHRFFWWIHLIRSTFFPFVYSFTLSAQYILVIT